MEMVLELLSPSQKELYDDCFNPSSNGNGAGIMTDGILIGGTARFNPSSNGNGAGILHRIKFRTGLIRFQSFF